VVKYEHGEVLARLLHTLDAAFRGGVYAPYAYRVWDNGSTF